MSNEFHGLQSQAEPSVRLGPVMQLLNGEWVGSADGRALPVECPANKRVIAEIPRAGAEDVERAVQAAERAFTAWKKVTPSQRGRAMQKIADALEAQLEDFARIIAHETGNALRTQARPEAQLCVDAFRYFGGLASELKGEMLPLGDDILSYTRREPLGIVGAIVPWNAPAVLCSIKIAPALVAGNTMVLKLAEDAPFAGLFLAEICQRFLPPGVLNVVTGLGAECGAALASHPRIHKMSFTGSTGVGKSIMAAAAERIGPVSLELGGKSPTIVCDDADEEWVVQNVGTAMRFTRQSQSCTAGSRLFLHESIYDSFLEKLVKLMNSYKIGNPLDEATDMGSLISSKQYGRVCSYIEEGLKNPDVKLLTGGLPPTSGPLAEGYFTVPTLFGGSSNAWRLAKEEIFGPVLVVIPWKDDAQVLKMANDSHYGLAGYVFSNNTARAIRMAHEIDSGWVQVNQGKGQLFGQPYGGFKQSGQGKEQSLSSLTEGFSRLKTVTVNLTI
ncbi:aldehyde dehydrogenase family protein [Cupriavidus basilensis]|uniref:aldehyde dehydrogenase family protein n=1 Tax=Cupriavidus basilensis TaxID=68895 RepID=UPI000B230E1E|nr:aldehyde dehydrogenase family protein [Cupriavidus basilensis]